tara:strand:+ start:5951 stop:7036 length:1086 start_codon:yes stop_codon:yes gene_type:complete
MKIRINKILVSGAAIALLTSVSSNIYAGNEDRVGQSGASQLQINPWARSSGFANANTASVIGLESVNLNVAGLAFTNKTEAMFAHTRYLSGSEISINSFGLSQRIGETGVLGINVMSMNFGDIDITTVDLPEGGSGTYSPQFLNIGLSYAKEFSNSIYAGATVKVISEKMTNASASGVAFDAGIRYVTGKYDNVKFGIALKNVGPQMQFDGDGLSTKVTYNEEEFTLEQRTEPYELPSSLSIGVAYDYYIGVDESKKDDKLKAMHRITGAGNFLANSFGKDQVMIGAEYAFKEMFMVRAGLVYEDGIFDSNERTTVYTGPTAGLTVAVPINDKGSSIDIDYSYRDTNPFNGTHTVGIRINL